MAIPKARARAQNPFALAAIAAFFFAAAAAPALAQDQGNYFSIGGGYSIQNSSHFTGPIDIRSAFQDGYAARGALGHDFGPIRLEGEFGYRHNSAQSLAVTNAGGLPGVISGPATGTAKATSYMANALWDLDFGSKVTPYIGAGLGMAHIKMASIASGGAVTGSTADNGLAMQGIAGLAYALSDRLDLTVDYRYFVTRKYMTLIDTLGRQFSSRYRNQAIMAGLTFRFGGKSEPAPTPAAAPPPPPPPAAEPAPPPPPPPAPAPEAEKAPPPAFIVFFDFDSATVTDQGRQVIEQAAAAAGEYGAVRLIVTGHADRAGSEDYNMSLSLRRAKAVHDVLTARGIADGKIEVMAKGEDDPLVPTPDGVREPQNRRVEIVIQ
jgi:OmpA-OmpF porin, OOP family